MRFEDVSVPECYTESADFRLFLDWFGKSLTQLKYDTEHFFDLYDPTRCKKSLLWLLCDTMGYKYDDRLPTAFNRLVLLYFMSMIYNRGSKNGITLAGEVNLAQFNIEEYGKEDDIMYDRLDDTSIPVNSVSVTQHIEDGYIDITYFSTEVPVDACIEYVRPVGMYCFSHAGVSVDARTKISVDARLANSTDIGTSFGPTHVGHYRREDYARLQHTRVDGSSDATDTRHGVYYRNKKYEQAPNLAINPGYRSLHSLQLCNNDHIVKSLLKHPIFSIGYGPDDVKLSYPDDYVTRADRPDYNLRYDMDAEKVTYLGGVSTSRSDTAAVPKVNSHMNTLGDAIAIDNNTKYTKVENGEVTIKNV